MATIPMKEGRLVVVMDDLDLELEMLQLKQKVFNRYGTFD
jgi:peptidyl-tRNA hydrolase